nr:hypothetical protein [Rhodococcus qingshengii]
MRRTQKYGSLRVGTTWSGVHRQLGLCGLHIAGLWPRCDQIGQSTLYYRKAALEIMPGQALRDPTPI